MKFLQEGPIGLDNAAVYPPQTEQAGVDSREDCHRKKKRIENVRLHHGDKCDWLNGHTMGSGHRSHLDACWRQASLLQPSRCPRVVSRRGIGGAATLELCTVSGNTLNAAVRPD
jgi:hypothetical protein